MATGERDDRAGGGGAPARTEDRSERMEQRLAVPVIVAAIASIPAVFLTSMDPPAEHFGQVLNWASLTVLTAESVLLFWAASDRRAWLRQHWWLVAISVTALVAVIFALGPAQLLRLVRFVGAIRLIRVNRILKAGRILRDRAGFRGPVRNAIAVGVSVIAAAFVALVLADPTSTSRQAVDTVLDRFGIWPSVAAGLILAGATFVVVRYRREAEEDSDSEDPDEPS